MKLQARKWKNLMRRLVSNDVDFAYYIFKQADKDYRIEIRRLKGNGLTQQEIAECTSSWEAEVVVCYGEYKESRSRKWLNEAIKLSVPPPNRPLKLDAADDPIGCWEYLSINDSWVLTAKGIHYIRREIREVQKTEHERRLRWTTPTIAVLALSVGIFNLISSML